MLVVLTRAGHAVQFRVVPGDRERDRRVEEDVEVIGVVRVLPEIVGIHNQPALDSLLESGIELIPEAGLDGRRLRAEDILRESAGAGAARKDQVLVERSLECPRVGGAQHRVRFRNEIGNREARLNSVGGGQAVVLVFAQADVDGEISGFDRVLDIEAILVDIGLPVKEEQGAAAGQVVRHKARLKIRICHVGGIDTRALVGIGHARQEKIVPVGVQTHRIVGRIGDAELEVLEQPRLLEPGPQLEVWMPCW